MTLATFGIFFLSSLDSISASMVASIADKGYKSLFLNVNDFLRQNLKPEVEYNKLGSGMKAMTAPRQDARPR